MLIQRTILKEMAVDFLIQVEQSGLLDRIEPRQIDPLLRKIKADMINQFEEWRKSERRCEKAEELNCLKTKEQCLRCDCPYRVLGEQFLELFTKRFDRMVKNIKKRYGLSRKKKRVKIAGKGANGKDWWQQYFEQRMKELMVRNDKRLVDAVMKENFLEFRDGDEKYWFLKARKRKKDGRVIINVSFPPEFIQKWPISVQAELLRLRNKMRTPEELAPRIRACAAFIRDYLEMEKRAKKKRKRARQKARKNNQ